MNHNLENKLQNLYKEINAILPLEIDFDFFKLEVDRSGANIYKSNEIYLDSKNKIYDEIRKIYSPEYVIDVGANIGFSTILFSKVFNPKEIISIEPNRNLIEIIKRNCHINRVENANILNVLIGDSKKEFKKFQINTMMSVDSRVSSLKSNFEEVDVMSTSIDLICKEYNIQKESSVFIKIDTQGYEEEVLKGMKELLSTFEQYCIVMEFAPYWLEEAGTNPEKFIREVFSSFNVCEFPIDNSFYPIDLLEYQKNTLKPFQANDFVKHVKSLRRNNKGWVDLMIYKNKS